MEIILHAHHADIPDTLRSDAMKAIRRIASRLHRVVDAVVRFIGDGPTRRVEIVLRGANRPDLFVHADARAFRPALSTAVQRLERQIRAARRSHRAAAVDGAIGW